MSDNKPQKPIHVFSAEEINQIIANDDFRDALKVMRQLEKAGSTNTATYRAMQFIRFAQISEQDCLSLLSNYLLEGLRLPNYNLIGKFEARISFIHRSQEQEYFIQQALDALTKNTQRLGTQPITVENQPQQPLVKHWLLDYDLFPIKVPERGSLEQVDYMNRSKNAASLAKEDRATLLDLIKVYDVLKNTLYEFKNATEIDITNSKEFDLNKIYFSEDDVDNSAVSENNESVLVGAKKAAPPPLRTQPPASLLNTRPKANPPTAPQPKPQKQNVPQAPPRMPKVPVPPAKVNVKPDSAFARPTRSINIQELLNHDAGNGSGEAGSEGGMERGVKLNAAASNSLDLNKILPATPEQPQKNDIEKKLEELKKKQQ